MRLAASTLIGVASGASTIKFTSGGVTTQIEFASANKVLTIGDAQTCVKIHGVTGCLGDVIATAVADIAVLKGVDHKAARDALRASIQNIALTPGEKGNTGAQGTHTVGVDGKDGSKGVAGIDGNDGAKGAVGAVGGTGNTGSKGAAGVDGNDGAKGDAGVDAPTPEPTKEPTKAPTAYPTAYPTASPTKAPTKAPIDGGWGAYGTCSQTCGAGVDTRTCTDPAPQFGGADCSGLDGGSATRPCNDAYCHPYSEGAVTQASTGYSGQGCDCNKWSFTLGLGYYLCKTSDYHGTYNNAAYCATGTYNIYSGNSVSGWNGMPAVISGTAPHLPGVASYGNGINGGSYTICYTRMCQ